MAEALAASAPCVPIALGTNQSSHWQIAARRNVYITPLKNQRHPLARSEAYSLRASGLFACAMKSRLRVIGPEVKTGKNKRKYQ